MMGPRRGVTGTVEGGRHAVYPSLRANPTHNPSPRWPVRRHCSSPTVPHLLGPGRPMGILEAGHNDALIVRSAVQEAVSAPTRVCSYDRANVSFPASRTER